MGEECRGGRTERPGPRRHPGGSHQPSHDAAELVAHTRVLEGLRSGTHQYQKIMAAHILSGSSPNTGHALRLVSHWRHKKAPILMQQMLRMRRGVPTLTPAGATKCNCLPTATTAAGGGSTAPWTATRTRTLPVGCALPTSPWDSVPAEAAGGSNE